MAVELSSGSLRVGGSALWLDARRKQDLCFVSHAHTDHIRRHLRPIATSATLRLMAHRLGDAKSPLALEYGEALEVDGLRLELFSAGHVLGSAQLRVTRPDGLRVVYTGDLNTAPSLTAPPAPILPCDVLVIEATFGQPRYVFPSREAVFDQLARWCAEQRERDRWPVVLGYALGKCQEAIAALHRRGLRAKVHPQVAAICELYNQLGAELPYSPFEGELEDDEVLVFPPHVKRFGLPRHAAAVLTGWALDGAHIARRYRADTAFCISDHADYAGLCAYAKGSMAKEIICVHGFTRELAASLRELGLPARSIDEPMQLPLFASVA